MGPGAVRATCSRNEAKMKTERLIRRHEHNYFHGWVVSTKRRGKRWAKYFSDKPAGRTDALRRARQYRQWLLEQLPVATKVKRTYVLNTTGEVGVALVVERTRAGRLAPRYVAQWPTSDGRRAKASFSVALYGKSEARRRAIEARRGGLTALLGSWA
jgi:hypothetical protein